MKNSHGTDLNLKQSQPNPSSQDRGSSHRIRNNIYQVRRTLVSAPSPPVIEGVSVQVPDPPSSLRTTDSAPLRLKAGAGDVRSPVPAPERQRTRTAAAIPGGPAASPKPGWGSALALVWHGPGMARCLTARLLTRGPRSPPSAAAARLVPDTPDWAVKLCFAQSAALPTRFAASYLQLKSYFFGFINTIKH